MNSKEELEFFYSLVMQNQQLPSFMKNRKCPYCQEETISRKNLVLQTLYIPGIVSECKNCHAVVSIKSSDNPLWGVALEILVFVLAIASINLFGSIWWGIALFVSWRISRLLEKSNAQLEYIR
ncbi:hypothetical protein [Microbulbifer litoralis]|uniref:hypothetical protein n=1 Tax=Microbulbifer litoralis TaxID=2933965 RepID=UPI002027945D|nr:hypothetical protein [Microbulbifer sp. GX H0434]